MSNENETSTHIRKPGTLTANRPRTASRAPSFPPIARPYTKGLSVHVSLAVMRG